MTRLNHMCINRAKHIDFTLTPHAHTHIRPICTTDRVLKNRKYNEHLPEYFLFRYFRHALKIKEIPSLPLLTLMPMHCVTVIQYAILNIDGLGMLLHFTWAKLSEF